MRRPPRRLLTPPTPRHPAPPRPQPAGETLEQALDRAAATPPPPDADTEGKAAFEALLRSLQDPAGPFAAEMPAAEARFAEMRDVKVAAEVAAEAAAARAEGREPRPSGAKLAKVTLRSAIADTLQDSADTAAYELEQAERIAAGLAERVGPDGRLRREGECRFGALADGGAPRCCSAAGAGAAAATCLVAPLPVINPHTCLLPADALHRRPPPPPPGAATTQRVLAKAAAELLSEEVAALDNKKMEQAGVPLGDPEIAEMVAAAQAAQRRLAAGGGSIGDGSGRSS